MGYVKFRRMSPVNPNQFHRADFKISIGLLFIRLPAHFIFALVPTCHAYPGGRTDGRSKWKWKIILPFKLNTLTGPRARSLFSIHFADPPNRREAETFIRWCTNGFAILNY